MTLSPRYRRLLIGLPLLFLAAACGDSTDLELGDLSEAEAGALFAALTSVWFPSPSAPSAAPPGPSLAPETTVRVDTTDAVNSCGVGGTVSIFSVDSTSITVDVRLNPSPDTTFASNAEYGGTSSTTIGYAGCQAADGQGGTWTFDSESGLTFEYDIDGTLDSYTLTGAQPVISSSFNWAGLWTGSFGWTNGSRSGTCSISLTSTSMTANNAGQIQTSFSQQGQICGLDISSGS